MFPYDDSPRHQNAPEIKGVDIQLGQSQIENIVVDKIKVDCMD